MSTILRLYLFTKKLSLLDIGLARLLASLVGVKLTFLCPILHAVKRGQQNSSTTATEQQHCAA